MSYMPFGSAEPSRVPWPPGGATQRVSALTSVKHSADSRTRLQAAPAPACRSAPPAGPPLARRQGRAVPRPRRARRLPPVARAPRPRQRPSTRASEARHTPAAQKGPGSGAAVLRERARRRTRLVHVLRVDAAQLRLQRLPLSRVTLVPVRKHVRLRASRVSARKRRVCTSCVARGARACPASAYILRSSASEAMNRCSWRICLVAQQQRR